MLGAEGASCGCVQCSWKLGSAGKAATAGAAIGGGGGGTRGSAAGSAGGSGTSRSRSDNLDALLGMAEKLRSRSATATQECLPELGAVLGRSSFGKVYKGRLSFPPMAPGSRRLCIDTRVYLEGRSLI